MRHARASVLVAPLAILVLLGSTLVGTDRLGFRDVSHFYTPLYEYVAQRQSKQWVPLWNPLDHTGIPLAGETTTAVFYPVRFLVFSLPIDAEVAIAWYVALHLILASFAAWTAARWSGVSAIGASIGAVAYAMSGSVLFLYSNPPFLVGAAWLPFVLGSLLCNTGPSQTIRIMIASSTLAMMVLGGDPQTAFHGMIMVAAVWLVRRLRREPSPLRFRGMMIAPLAAAILAAPQIAASLDWSRQSDRVGQNQRDDSWFAPPVVGSRRYQAFEYSLPPWHTIEMVTPNAFGRLFPTNQRLSKLIPGDGRMWTPSIYMGMLVAMACVLQLWRWRTDGIDVWVGIAMLSISLAMGHFGIVWWLQASTGWLASLDSAVGGPYWFAYHFVPGYDSFRYPAKWLSVFSLSAAMITARFLDQEACRERLRRFTLPTLITMGIAAISIWLGLSVYMLIHEGPASSLVADEFWGPLQPESALARIALALVHSCIVVGILAWLLWRARSASWSSQKLMGAILFLLVLDTTIAARDMILRVPRVTERKLIGDYDSMTDLQVQRWMRTHSGGGWPLVWVNTSSDQRALEVEASGQVAWFARWHLSDHQAMLNSMVSIRSHDVALFWEATRALTKTMTPTEQREYWNSMRTWLGVQGIVHTSDRSRDVSLDQQRFHLVDRQARVDRHGESLQVHQQWKLMKSATPDLSMMQARLLEIASADGDPIPVIQIQSSSSEPTPLPSTSPTTEPNAITAGLQSEEVGVFDVELGSSALLTRRVYQDGNWTARYQPQGSETWIPVDVYQVDYLTQGVVLPEGKHRLQFRYHPWWLTATLSIALVGWLGIVVYLPMQKRLNTRSRISSV